MRLDSLPLSYLVFLVVAFKIVSVLSKSRQVETIFLVMLVQFAVLGGERREKAFSMTVMRNS